MLSGAFQKFQLASNLERAILRAGFVEPRPIQLRTIPAALRGQDVLGLAQTGTGKTAAFALPILGRLGEDRHPGPRALVLAPTRELAKQIHDEFETLARYSNLSSMTIFGGVPQGTQVRNLRKRPDILVACPGRLLDLMEQGEVKLNHIEVLVLDEADHMFDMGFLPAIRRILRALPKQRQNLLFSATMPKEIRKLADEVLVKPCVAELANAQPAETIEHGIFRVAQTDKFGLLRHLLDEPQFKSAIVFTRTKFRAKRLAQQLDKRGLRAVALQGNMSQNQRDKAMTGFRKGQFDVLVATDIAARGIDVAGISHVVNFDVPGTPDAYTHRIGRTGRSETSGMAYTFVSGDDFDQVKAIERQIGSKLERLRAEGFVPGDASDVADFKRGPRGQQNSGGRGGQSQGRSRGGAGAGRARGNSNSAGRGAAPSRAASRSVERAPEPRSQETSDAKPFGSIGDFGNKPTPGAEQRPGQLRNRAQAEGPKFGDGLDSSAAKGERSGTDQAGPGRKYRSTGGGGSRRGGRRRGMSS